MLKRTLRLFALAGALAGHAAAAAQGQGAGTGGATAPEWQRLAPPGEEFAVELPAAPDVYHTSRFIKDSPTHETEKARIYAAYHDGVVFLVAAFDNPRAHEKPGFFAAEFFRTPELPNAAASFAREVRAGEARGWQYAFKMQAAEGVARVFLTPNHAYMAEAVGGGETHPAVARFLASFRLTAPARAGARDREPAPATVGGARSAPDPAAAVGPGRGGPLPPDRAAAGTGSGVGLGGGTGEGGGGGPGRAGGGATVGRGGQTSDQPDYSRPFRQSEVDQRAVPVFRPGPGFTEEARRNNVVGTVRLRGTLTSAGTVTNITVVKGLPDGLTERAIAAARRIRFLPAVKDGRRVSQWITLEYNFNIY